jgi:hypothetical protein
MPMKQVKLAGKCQLMSAWKVICQVVSADAHGRVLRSVFVAIDNIAETVEFVRHCPAGKTS